MQRLANPRVWLGGGAFAALVIVAVGWTVFIGPKLSSAHDLLDQASSTRAQNDQLLVKAKSLEAKSARLPQYTTSLRTALAALPYDSGLPAFTRQVNAQARASGVTVSSVVVGGVSPVAPVATTPPATGATPTPSTTTTAAGSLYALQMTVQSQGSLARQLAFLNAIRTTGPRRALVTATQVTPATGSKSLSIDRGASFTTQLSIFSAPQSPGQIVELKKLLRGDLGN